MRSKILSPYNSVWISASAGTGKTKILTDRILSLLINGATPEEILCLTFTKAARGEMLDRLNAKLKFLSSLRKRDVENFLEDFYGQKTSSTQIDRAINLYETYAVNSQKIGIYTIHAFCQNLLQKFPIEADLRPSFNVIDEVDSSKFIKKIIKDENILESLLKDLWGDVSIFSLENILISTANFIIKNKDFLQTGIKSEEFYQKVISEYGIKQVYLNDITSLVAPENLKLLREFYPNIAYKLTNLINYIKSEKSSKDKDLNKSASFNDIFILSNSHDRLVLEDLLNEVLNKDRSPKKKLINKKIVNKAPGLKDFIEKLQLYLQEYVEYVSVKYALNKNSKIYNKSLELVQKYISFKERNNILDYDDLINKAFNLLNNSQMREWVRYKLDGGINHILVDESQDTSRMQWQIIESIISDFFAGQGAKSENDRSIFVVGDVKQSIYGFQGARPDLFVVTKEKIKKLANDAGKNFIDLGLNTTYRLPESINNFTKNLFKNLDISEDISLLESDRNEHSKIEVWPLLKNLEETKKLKWALPEELDQFEEIEKILAEKIARYISDKIKTKTYIASQKRYALEEDFLILVQRRGKLNYYLKQELGKYKCRVAGSDRVSISESISARDILVVLKFIINKYDEFNLAHLLKSPFIGIEDEQLYKLRKNYNNLNLYDACIESSDINISENLQIIIDLYNNTTVSQLVLSLIENFNLISFYENKCLNEEVTILKTLIHELESSAKINKNSDICDLIDLIENSGIEIKRAIEKGEGVRIMTAHGAKGLESPFVILADSNDLNLNITNDLKKIPIKNNQNDIPFWNIGTKTNFAATLNEKIKSEEYTEYLRLLYVAVTRAQDNLIITGKAKSNINEIQEGSWYNLALNEAQRYFTLNEKNGVYEFPPTINEYSNNKEIIYNSQERIDTKIECESTINTTSTSKINEENVNFSDSKDINLCLSKRISQPGLTEKEHIEFDDYGVEIGLCYHKILEYYAKKISNLDKFIDLEILTFPDYLASKIKLNIKQILKDKYLNDLLKHKYYSEIEFFYKDSTEMITAVRLDLLVFKEEEIIIVDYKSDNIISDRYEKQLSLYRKIVQDTYKNMNVKCLIFWILKQQWSNVY